MSSSERAASWCMRQLNQRLAPRGKLARERESFNEVAYDWLQERKVVAALRQFFEVDSHKALVSVKLLDQDRVLKDVVGPTFNLWISKMQRSKKDQKSVSCESVKDGGQKAFVDNDD